LQGRHSITWATLPTLLSLIFWEIFIMFFILPVSIYTPINRFQFISPHPL
jgi:hypothetical protein